MAQVSVSEAIPASADRVWALIGGFGDLRWLPAIASCTVTDEGANGGIGAIRILGFVGNDDYARERQDARDEAGRSYTYSVIETSVPLTGYRGVMRVAPDGDDRCVLHWSSTFAATDGEDAALAASIEQIYRAGVARVTALVGG